MSTIDLYLTSTGRSGSTFLRSLLSSHPDIRIEGEFLYQDPTVDSNWLYFRFWADMIKEDISWISPNRKYELYNHYLHNLSTRRGNIPNKFYGMDLKLEQLDNFPWMADRLLESESKFIILKRANLLKQVLSEVAMYMRLSNSIMPHGSKSQQLLSVTVDPIAIVQRMRYKKSITESFLAKVKTNGNRNRCVVVTYESLIAQNGCINRNILDGLVEFIGAEPRDLTSDIVKQNPFSVEEMVINYDDLVHSIMESEFEYTLYLPF